MSSTTTTNSLEGSRTQGLSTEEFFELIETSQMGRLSGPEGDLPLIEISGKTVIDGLVSTTRYRQRFINSGASHLEVSYIFPLPARSAVGEFVAVLGGRRIEGVIKERGEARADYAAAMAESKRAGLVEMDRSDVFSVKLGNIAPGEEAEISLLVSGIVGVEDGEATFRFPLVCAPRYIAGKQIFEERAGEGLGVDTDEVPDATRLNPPRLTEHMARPKVSFEVEINYPGLTKGEIRSSHLMSESEVKKGKNSSSKWVLVLEEGTRADSDLLIRYKVATKSQMRAVIVKDAKKNSDGERLATWMVSLEAPVGEGYTPKDVIFVIDRSGSMGGWKMVAARRAAARLIDTLLAQDRFAVIGFDDQIERFTGGDQDESGRVEGTKLFAASDRNRFLAVEFLTKMTARGGTEMRGALVEAVEMLRGTPKSREAVVVLVTDGHIGGEGALMAELENKIGDTRFCVVGIDRAPNGSLLEKIGRRSRGFVSFVESEERLDETLKNLARRVGRADLRDVEISVKGALIIEGETNPVGTIDVFSGVAKVITGRCRLEGTALPVFSARGVRSTKEGTEAYESTARAEVSLEPGIDIWWAREKIAELEDAYDAGRGDRSLIRSAIIKVSLEKKILSRFCAFVAVDEESQEISAAREVVQPVEMPAGWAMNASHAVLAGGSMVTNAMMSSSLGSSTMTSGHSSVLGSSTGSMRRGGLTGDVFDSGMSSSVLPGQGAYQVGMRTPLVILREIVSKLQTASGTQIAVIGVLVKELAGQNRHDPLVLMALVDLYGYMAGEKTALETVTEITKVLRAMENLAGVVQNPGWAVGQGSVGHTGVGLSREFWS